MRCWRRGQTIMIPGSDDHTFVDIAATELTIARSILADLETCCFSIKVALYWSFPQGDLFRVTIVEHC
jgi:hypothetical protein